MDSANSALTPTVENNDLLFSEISYNEARQGGSPRFPYSELIGILIFWDLILYQISRVPWLHSAGLLKLYKASLGTLQNASFDTRLGLLTTE